jgi:hypothetical protein
MIMIATSTNRSSSATAPVVNARIAEATCARLDAIGMSAAAIARRLRDIDREWDIERVIQAHAAGVTLAGLAAARLISRKFLIVPAAISALLLLHAVQGFYPPEIVLRRLGFRTVQEIDEERQVLRFRQLLAG